MGHRNPIRPEADVRIASCQVAWWPVHELIAPVLDHVGEWPQLGTPAWLGLEDVDPAKWAAVLDAGQHWALRLDALQEASAEASKAVASAADWPKVAREMRRRRAFRDAHPWARRVVR